MKKPDLKLLILKFFPGIQSFRFKLLRTAKSAFVFLRHLPGSSLQFGPPRGLYRSTEAYNEQPTVSSNLTIREITLKPTEYCKRNLPKTNSGLVLAKFARWKTGTLYAKKAYILPKGRYLSGTVSTVVTADDKLFVPCSPFVNESNPEKHQALYRLKHPKAKNLDKVIVLHTSSAEDIYAHWLLDHLPRFYWLTKMELHLPDYTLITSNKGKKFQTSSLEALQRAGIHFKQVIDVQPDQHFICEELIIPPYSTDDLNQDVFSRDKLEMQFLQAVFIPKDRDTFPVFDKLYLSRRKSIRTFEGEAALATSLEEQGFKEVFLEDYTITEQALLFNKAKFIIGLHGSGFANLCFCAPGTTIVEIFGANFIVTDFWSVSNIMGLNYYAYCEDQYNKNIKNYRVARNESTMVSVDGVLSYLQKEKLLTISPVTSVTN